VPAADTEGELDYIHTAITDISERKLAERRYSTVLQMMQTGFWLFDLEGKFLEVNDAYCRMSGYSRDELLKMRISDVEAVENQSEILRHIEKASKKGFDQFETKHRRKDGSVFDADIRTARMDAEGNCHATFVIDISERKRMEDELRKLAAIVQHSSKFMSMASLDGKIIFVNDGGEKMLGIPEEKLGQMPILDVIADDFKDKVQNEVLPTLRKSGHWEGELQYKNLKTGKLTDVYATTFAIKDQKTGEALYLANTSIDITERKRAEEHLKQIKEELERSNKELEEFAQITSHDLREPLRAISGFIELLDKRHKDKWDEKSVEYIRYVFGGAKRLEELLNGLLEYSRVATRGQRATPLPAGLALKAAIRNLQKNIDESEAVITQDELPDVNADGTQLTRVFENLIDNAIKFRNEEKPKIHISCQKNDDRWRFSISDNGIGIDKQRHERIFKIFQRLHPQGQYPGYGLGLTICKKIVERHGGRIWVESEKGKGSTFHFTI
jgi:PAS domain S-box-containing protein